MGMFSRMTDIVQANINAMLDKAEDPEKMIKLIIQEMEEIQVEIRSVAAKNLAEQKTLERQISGLEKQAKEWHDKAELALSKGKEDLARAALVEKQSAVQKAESLKGQQKQVDEVVEKLRDDSQRLNEKLSEAKAKQKSIVVRQQSAAVRLKARSQGQEKKIDEAITRMAQYEARIDQLESQVDAYDLTEQGQSLQQQFNDLEAEESIEKELEALKKKVA